MLAGQVAAGGHAGAGFLGDLAHEGVAGSLAGFELAAGEVAEPVVGADERDEPVVGEAEAVGLGDGVLGQVPAGAMRVNAAGRDTSSTGWGSGTSGSTGPPGSIGPGSGTGPSVHLMVGTADMGLRVHRRVAMSAHAVPASSGTRASVRTWPSGSPAARRQSCTCSPLQNRLA